MFLSRGIRIPAGRAISAPKNVWTAQKRLSSVCTSIPTSGKDVFAPLDTFARRHIGPCENNVKQMCQTIGVQNLDELIDKTVPQSIRLKEPLNLGEDSRVRGESDVLQEVQSIARKNRLLRNFIGMGYYGTITPSVLLRNVMENPGWYTPYTPYQAEISQGRLEALLNFQTMVSDLTGLPIANASLLDEATAAAEAMNMCFNHTKREVPAFFVSDDVHPQTLALLRTRAEPFGIRIIVGNHETFDFAKEKVCGALIQYPTSLGRVSNYSDFVNRAHNSGALVVAASDLLALTVITPPGEWDADICLGSVQRFGIPLGLGGPHAAFFSCKDALKRIAPGRLIGVSKDADGKRAYRMSLATREQHIRREKATSNICTSQALLANMAGFYATYHGPKGLKKIAERVHNKTCVLAEGLTRLGHGVNKHLHQGETFFDTIVVSPPKNTASKIVADAASKFGVNLRLINDQSIGISLDECTTDQDVNTLFEVFKQGSQPLTFNAVSIAEELLHNKKISQISAHPFFNRKSSYLQHPIFNLFHTEHEMLRYLFRLQSKDLGMNTSMISLGSCTMKLNATSEMIPITWPEFNSLHPFVPADQVQGFHHMFKDLENYLAKITGFHAISLQPNAGSQGEYTGIMVIRKFHASRGQSHRDVCLIPNSAHGTNPASAAMAGMRIVPVNCDSKGNVDVADLRAKAKEHAANLSLLMITYPSTHGVFEEGIREICEIVHQNGGQVYMDGANMNAQVGLTSPGFIGADVCHLNLHKTFCIPHGGGGPGMGPIGVAKHLAQFLPSHPVVPGVGGSNSIGTVSAGPWGSASILPITYVYIKMMGAANLTQATKVAILNANYMARRLAPHYPIVYAGKNGFVAHEFILDCRHFKIVDATDIAKRLMDFNFHAPTLAFPIAGTLMVEPTESESKEELDRFCEAMITIRKEVADVEEGRVDAHNNALKNAPHTAEVVLSDKWDRPYSREQAAYPLPYLRGHKFWPMVSRIDGVYGDRNLVCTCPPMEGYNA